MKKKTILAAGMLYMLTVFSACQGQKSSLAESHWKQAKESGDFYSYAAEHADEIDFEALKEEAGSESHSLSSQFKAVALMCALEYADFEETNAGADVSAKNRDLYQFDYPVSADYAEQFLAKVTEDEKGFWSAVGEAFYPYDCYEALFAATDHLDGQTLSQLAAGMPDDESYAMKFQDTVDQWIEENPRNISETMDALMQAGYFEDWEKGDWNQTYIHSYLNDDRIKADTAQEALAYVNFVHEGLLPVLSEKFGKDEYKAKSKITGKGYYTTKLTVTISEDLNLEYLDSLSKKDRQKALESGSSSKKIKLKGKKVAAFYRNPNEEDWKDSPSKLRLLGDFMLGLPEDECPASLDEADYILILTPNYSYGDFYKDQSGNITKIQEVYSSTSIDLYEAGTGRFLRRLGNVMEEPPYSIFKDLSEEAAQYPEIMTADTLSYIYHHVNDPDAYMTLIDHTSGLNSELSSGESVILGNWEITYHSYQAVKSFDVGVFRYTPNDGCQYVRAEFSVKNCGDETDTFLPAVYQVSEDPVVQIMDEKRKHIYDCVDALNDSRCLNSTVLDAGESKDGELIFEVPDNMLEKADKLFFVVSMGKQNASYRFRES